MRFYSTPSEHVEMLAAGLSDDLGIKVIDFLDVNLDTGYTQLAYVIGDCEPLGETCHGQEKQELEVELRLYVPITKDAGRHNAQTYALDLSTKIISLLKHRFYGFNDQREIPAIDSNDALAMSYGKRHQYCVRSIVFRQVVYAGATAHDLYDVTIEVK